MVLEQEFAYFETRRRELLQQHAGQYALIIGQRLVGTFETAEQAYEEGLAAYGNVPMLIHQITEEETIAQIPVLALVRGHADT